jgi:triosephosphate isomerase
LPVIQRQVASALTSLKPEQRRQVVIAYEPVWAIGKPPAPAPFVAEEAAASLRTFLSGTYDSNTAAAVRILYGGAVQPDNVAGFLALSNVDGVLVGGASLKAESFVSVVEAAERAK